MNGRNVAQPRMPGRVESEQSGRHEGASDRPCRPDAAMGAAHQKIRVALLHGLVDLLTEFNFVEAQIQAISETAGPHRTRAVGTRIAALHHRLDDLDEQLKNCAQTLGVSGMSGPADLRHTLRVLTADAGSHI